MVWHLVPTGGQLTERDLGLVQAVDPLPHLGGGGGGEELRMFFVMVIAPFGNGFNYQRLVEG